jgi:hypothetical protein
MGWWSKDDPGTMYFEDPRDQDNNMTVAPADGGVSFSVMEEKAVDSFNSTFECTLRLSYEEVEQLVSYLTAELSKAATIREKLG